MLLQEIRDIFISRYKLEMMKLKQEPIQFPEQLIALWLSQAKKEVLTRIKNITGYTELLLGKDNNIVSLPSDFGSEISVIINSNPINKITLDSDKSGYSIFQTQDGYKLKYKTDNDITVLVNYNINTDLYSTSKNKIQDWGQFDGSTYKGLLGISDDFLQCILYFMLDQAVGGFTEKFEQELAKQRQLENSKPLTEKLIYSMQ